ncbi:MAG: GH25 family lysozyme [Anaerolineales bacterium]|jgi:GH25 family lysozyme M1 (1,4-beta-N-acetylmuramidase)
MAERQALGIDISEYSRTGGINYALVKKNVQEGVYDFLIIKAGAGTSRSPLFEEQKQNVEQRGIPYATYHFTLPGQNMKEQAQKYVDWVGTDQPVYILDVETPLGGDRPPNRDEMREIIDEMVELTNKEPVIYSRMDVLQRIGFVNDARQYRLWIAQYLWDRSHLPSEKLQYHYLHDFTRDFSWSLPPSIQNTAIEENVILWQFSEKGKGPYYIYNLRTADPNFPIGKKSADLNISIKGRDEFMQLMFGGVSVATEVDAGEEEGEDQPVESTFPDMTNQDMLNLIFTAARPFTDDPWMDWIVRANLEYLAIPNANRSKPYTGPKIEDLPNLTAEEKAAISAVMMAQIDEGQPEEVPYPGMTNQDMINLIFTAAVPFTDDPWVNWIVRANLEYLAIPNVNRNKLYTGPKIEDLPNLTAEEKAAILAVM